MKKAIAIIRALIILLVVAACGNQKFEWTREGSYKDDDGNYLTIEYLADSEENGWYLECLLGEKSYSSMLNQEGDTLHGDLNPDNKDDPFIVTISEEGEKDVKMVVEGGKTYHFKYYDIKTSDPFVVKIHTEGNGSFAYAEHEDELEFDTEYPVQSAQLNLTAASTYVMQAKAVDGWKFVKWTKDGADYSTDEKITVELTETAEFIAVFETVSTDGQNAIMNFIGNYVSGRARALVEADGMKNAKITIEWSSSVDMSRKWVIKGSLDTERLLISYENAIVTDMLYNPDGTANTETLVTNEDTGSITFTEDGSFLWNDQQIDQQDMKFTWSAQ